MKNNFWNHQRYDIHYYTAGNTDRPTLIFLHGFLGSGLDWKEVIDHFAKKFHCIAPDLPGHGKTIVKKSPADYTMESFAGVFRRFLSTLGVLQSSLIGYSMGGRLALFLAVHFPTLWESVILESVSPGLRTEKERLERQKKDEKIAGKLENESLDKFLKYWYQQPLFESIKKNKNFPSLFSKRLKNDPHLLATSLRMMGLGKQPSLWKAGERMEIPILLLTGEFDRKFCNILKEAHSAFPHSDFQIIANAGHNVRFEQPTAYYKCVNQFLKKTVS